MRAGAMKDEDAAVLFSGGTDSSLAAALAAEKFGKVHLVTYDRYGLFSVDGTKLAARGLREKYGEGKFEHAVIAYDRLFEHVSYEKYLSNLRKHGFFLLSVCGLCKLAMHVRTIVYCMDNGIKNVCDGANKGMDLFPAQMEPVIQELRALYARFGIDYLNPVFDFEPPEEGDFIEKQNLALVRPGPAGDKADPGKNARTAGHRLFQLGLAPKENIKGTDYDRKRQPRCFQFILFNIFAIKYFLAARSEEEYKEGTLKLFRDKIQRLQEMLEAYACSGSFKDILKQ